MKIVIAGGTGLIGKYLSEKFKQAENEVIIVSRQLSIGYSTWDATHLKRSLEGADVVINLAGKSVNCRHNAKNKEAILKSRLISTDKLGSVITMCNKPPKIWINASGAAIYSSNLKQPATENSTENSTDFLSQVIRDWENKFFSFQLPKTRQIALRTSVVLSNKGGAFLPLFWLSKLGLGGKQGNGKQKFSWIHIEDYYEIILFLIENEVNGLINCTSPNPVSNSELMKSYRICLGQKIGLPAPEFIVKLSAQLIGTESSLLLNSSFLYPQKLVNSGFKFNYPTIDIALLNLINN